MLHKPNLKCGLLGEHLTHSYSPQIHRELADYSYGLFEMPENEVAGFLASDRFDAINVTIPYKKTVLPYLSEISDEAKRIGSVNTITRLKNGGLRGDNTDYFGFSYMLDKSGIDVAGKKVLILGSGGAQETARTVCRDRSATVIVISRRGENNYDNLDKHRDASVIINTTPVGMYPHNGTAPLDLARFPHLTGVLDMIYNPEKTKLLLDAERLGIPHLSGLPMLVAQAKLAAEIFASEKIEDHEIDRIVKKITLEMNNIVLIGMAGCGKSTVGAALTNLTGRELVDTDAMVTEKTGRTPAAIIKEDGESAFRRIETECVAEAGKMSGKIIATGGGVPTIPENTDLLRQNGKIIFLRRAIEELDSSGRPLSLAAGAAALYRKRLPLYEALADLTVDNDDTPDTVAQKILNQLQ
ncbi:MAG: shikimate kinase [Ruminococcaceae bacterium]|nr:shikimate kinase [Oscillospiraceae bacterium]